MGGPEGAVTPTSTDAFERQRILRCPRSDGLPACLSLDPSSRYGVQGYEVVAWELELTASHPHTGWDAIAGE